MNDANIVNAFEGLTPTKQLKLFRNLYYNEGYATERGIIANAINDILPEYSSQKAENERLKEKVKGFQELWCGAESDLRTARVEAAKDFVEKFENKINDVQFTLGQIVEIDCALKDVVKEMTGEKSLEITEREIDTMGECELLPFERDEKSCGDLRREILQDAEACVCSDRNLSYGEPEDNFAVIAELWTGYLNGLLHAEGSISLCSEEVADMMILFKVARNATAVRRKRDTYVDIAGYAACAGSLIE